MICKVFLGIDRFNSIVRPTFAITNPERMKTKLLALNLFLVLGTLSAQAFPSPDELTSNYVVIGAFSVQQNALHFAASAKRERLQAEIDINPNRGLYYVYVLHTGDRERAIEEAKKLREKSDYNDTWVYSGFLGKDVQQSGKDVNPVNEKPIEKVVAEEVVSQPVVETQPASIPSSEPVSTTVVEDADPSSKKFLFKIFTSNGELKEGEVNIIDLDKQKKGSSYKGNQLVAVKPVNQSGNISLECQVFGYRKISHAINFSTPAATEGVTVEDGQATVPSELVRLKKGDYSVMYNVFFYKDAAIMRPESKYEVNQLLGMLKENPKYKIRIHGHTNGNAAGKVISMGEKKNFFSLTGSKEGFGSAKKLSEERGNAIREYLISEGVAEDRLSVKAWGGKKPVYEKDHAQAHTNVRVEIEIVEE